MFGKQKQGPQAQQAAKPKVQLTLAEKREIRKIMEVARGDGKAHSAQDTLPFRQMYPDGLCKLDENTWSKCIEFEDVITSSQSPTTRPLSLKPSAICITPMTPLSEWNSPL